MKISKEQQEQNRRQLISAAVELITSQGFEETTMKQIARAAGLGDATIYKYFPTKEKLLLGYYEQVIADTLIDTAQTPGIDQFKLQERLQRLVDAFLERLLADREFVQTTRRLIADSPMLMLREGLPGQQALKKQISEFVTSAEQAGEIPICDFRELLSGLFGDYLLSVTAYWLKDESEEFADTTQLVDLTLGLAVMALQSGIINKILELGGFLLRSHLSRWLQHRSGILETLKMLRSGLEGRKA